MITPTHVHVYNLRREDLLIECARERLVNQAMRGAAASESRRLHLPTDTLVRLLAAFGAWRHSASVVPAT